LDRPKKIQTLARKTTKGEILIDTRDASAKYDKKIQALAPMRLGNPQWIGAKTPADLRATDL